MNPLAHNQYPRLSRVVLHCELISFPHIYREDNMAADWMAKYGYSLRSHSLSIFSSPPCHDFFLLLVDDNLGRTLERGLLNTLYLPF